MMPHQSRSVCPVLVCASEAACAPRVFGLSASFSIAVLGAVLGAALLGCTDTDSLAPVNETGGTGGVGGAGGSVVGGADNVGGGQGGEGGMPPLGPRATIAGDITWTVAFDEVAEDAGATDCSYTRHYEGVEDTSAPWLCPSCEVIFRADVVLTSGLEDCVAQISTGRPSEQEWIGYGDGIFWRSSQGPMAEQGTATVETGTVVTANSALDLEAPLGGTFALETIDGLFTTSEEVGDPAHGFASPSSYDCGWPKADPPPYTGDYQLTIGDTVPDGLFKDRCEQSDRLHDFQGSYLMIDMSALDCPACQSMAGVEAQFVEEMAAEGIDFHVITLLAPSLSNVFGDTTTDNLGLWIDKFGLTSPVLADRSWGQAMFGAYEDAGAYPSWVLVAPDLTAFEYGQGFGGFTEIKASIIAHQSGN